MNPRYAAFVEARDFLLARRTHYDAACKGFRWPRMREFNWALDYFDPMARGNDRPALWIAGADGREQKLSFAELSARSNQVANWLRALGVERGDRILLMLGNERALWETMLAAMKMGAVIVPASPLLTTDDVRERIERGQVKHVVVSAAQIQKFARIPGSYTRILVAPVGTDIGDSGTWRMAPSGWRSFSEAYSMRRELTPSGVTLAADPLLLFFTGSSAARAKLVVHSHHSYPIGHLSTMYWMGVMPGDVHLGISPPGSVEHAWNCLFAPWNAGACVFVHDCTRFDPGELLAALQKHGVTVMCARPAVWRVLLGTDLGARDVKLRELLALGEPVNAALIEQVRSAWGLEIRDGFAQTETTHQIGHPPGEPARPGTLGRALPGCRITLLDRNGNAAASEGEMCLSLAEWPVGLMLEYAEDPEAMAHAMRAGHYHTGIVARRDADGFLTSVGCVDELPGSQSPREEGPREAPLALAFEGPAGSF